MRVMAFGPHPDDIELLCAGTLAKYRAAGHEVAMAVVTSGNVGSPTLSRSEIAAAREREARASAAVIGAEFFWLGYDDEFLYDTLEVRRQEKLLQLNPTALKILQALMEASPAVVTRQELETRVWGEELPDSDSLRVHIHGLRAVVDKPFDSPYIQTRHGIGYRIAAPDASS